MVLSDTSTFFKIGGTLPADAPSYVVRDTDQKLLQALLDAEYCYLLNTRQMGKSSLCVRVQQQLQEHGIRTVYLELSEIGGSNVEPATWYATLLNRIGRELGLHREFAQHRRERMELTPVSWLFSALEDIALPRNETPIVIILDEIDAVRSLPFRADEFFGALRSLYNRRVSDRELRRLTFCLVGSATPADLVSDTRLSPFNIGRLIDLRDFTRSEMAPLGEGLSRGGRNGVELLDRVYYWTGGHPFLTQSVCARIAEDPTLRTIEAVDALVAEMFFERSARRGNVHLADVSNRMLTRKTGEIDPADDGQKAAILALYEQVWRERSRVADDETNPLVALLKLSGIVRVERGMLRVRNRIYARVFDRDWIAESRPDAEKRRLESAFRAGQRRAILTLGAVVLVFGVMALFASWQQYKAEKSQQMAEWEVIARDTDAGTATVQAGDPFGALPFFAEAWTHENDPGHRVAHAARLSEVLTQSPRLLQAWPTSKIEPFVGFTDNSTLPVVTRDPKDPEHPHLTLREPSGQPGALPLAPRANKLTAQDTHPHVAALSPDRQFLLTTWFVPQENQTLGQVWDVTGSDPQPVTKSLTLATGHPPDFFQLTDGGKRVLTGEEDRFCTVLNTADGRVLLNLTLPPTGIRPAISRDGRRLALASGESHDNVTPAVLYDLDAPKMPLMQVPVWGRILSLALDQDATHIVLGTPYGAYLSPILPSNAPKVLRFPEKPDGARLLNTSYTTAVVFAASPARVLASNSLGEVFIYSVPTASSKPTLITAFQAHDGLLSSLSLSRDNTRLLTSSIDHTARLWNGRTGEPLSPPLRMATDVTTADLSPDGRFILYAGHHFAARLWDTAPPRVRQLATMLFDRLTGQIVFSPNGRVVAVAQNEGGVILVDPQTGTALTPWLSGRPFNNDPFRPPLNICFSPDGRLVATLSQGSATDLFVSVYDGRTGKHVTDIRHPSGKVITCCRFSADGRLCTAGDDGFVYFWDPNKGTPIGNPLRLNAPISDIAVSPDGQWVAVISPGKGVWVWNPDSGKNLALAPPDGKVPGDRVTFSPKGETVLCYGVAADRKAWEPHEVVIWNVLTGALVSRLPQDTAALEARFSPDGQRLLTRTTYSTVAYLWNLKTGKWATPPLHHSQWIQATAYSPDGHYVATGDLSGSVCLWDAESGTPIGYRRDARQRNITTGDDRRRINTCCTLAISPDGRSLAAGGWLGAVCWDMPGDPGSPEEIRLLPIALTVAEIQHQEGIRNASLVPFPTTEAQTDAAWADLERLPTVYRNRPVTPPYPLLRQRARTALNRGDWGSAVELLSTLLETTESDPDDPDDRQALEDRAYAFARLNRLPAALEDLNRIAHLVKQDKDLVLLLERASLYLTYGDSRGYAALCKTAVDTDEPGTAGKIDATVLRLIALDKDGILSVKSQEKDFKAIVAVVSAASPSGGNAPGSALARIGILYRQGHDQEAAALYSQVRASALWSALSAADRAWMMVFAGMANAHLGHRDLSRALFAQVDSYLSPPPQRQPDWWDHFMISVLRREAGGSAGSGSATVP